MGEGAGDGFPSFGRRIFGLLVIDGPRLSGAAGVPASWIRSICLTRLRSGPLRLRAKQSSAMAEEGSASRPSGGPRLSEPQRVRHRVALALETKPFWHDHTLRLRA